MTIRQFPRTAVAIAALAVVGSGYAALAGEVRGTVVMAPKCPGPTRVGEKCAPTPIATTIDVFRSPNDPTIPGKPYRRIKSDKQGRFKISLDPNIYWFVPHVPQPYTKIPAAKPQRVAVSAGTVTVTLVLDTGMR
jgi:hypothetical protein